MSPQFCNLSNIESCLKHVSRELSVLDYNYDLSRDNLTVGLINAVHALTSDVKKLNLNLSKKTDEFLRLHSLHANVVQAKDRFQKLAEKEENLVLKLKDQIQELTGQKDAVEKELNSSKAEVGKLLKSVNVQKLHHEHSLRRKEQLIESLTNKLEAYMGDDNVDKKPLLKPIEPIESSNDLQMYINTIQNNLQFTVAENANIRTFLLNNYKRFSAILRSNWPKEKDFPLATFSEAFLFYPSSELLNKMEISYEIIFAHIHNKCSS